MSADEDLDPSSSADEGGPAQAAGKRRSTRATSAAVKEKLVAEVLEEGSLSPERPEDIEDKPPPRPPPPPRSPEEMKKEQLTIRSMWELASIFDFLHLFNEHYLKLPVDFTADELETQLLCPTVGNLLKDIHIGLLKPIYPPSRPPADRTTWATVLTKKLCNAWPKLAEGECPLHPAQGEEQSVYEHMSPADRVRILKALCELRLEQEDIHSFVEGSLKDGIAMEAFRLQPIGTDSSGWVYWLPQPDGGDFVHRLYRESPNTLGKGKRGIGRRAPVPLPGNWETLATTLREFQEVSGKLLESRHRADVRIGRHINETVVPNLEELERKKERAIKKQLRHQAQLHASWNAGLAAGRSRRERKAVNYTFDDYDRSINDAIKVTRRVRSSLDPHGLHRDRDRLGTADEEAAHGGTANEAATPGDGQSPEERNGHATAGPPPEGGPTNEDEGAAQAATNLRSGRTSRKPSRLAENVADMYEGFTESEEEDSLRSDDEIAGEAEYTEEYEEARQRKRKRKGSDDDEEYRGEEDEPEDDVDDEAKEEDDDAFEPSDEDEEIDRRGRAKRSRTSKAAAEESTPQWGTRRSSRSSKSHIDYKQLDGGEEEDAPSHDEEPGAAMAAGQRRRGRRGPSTASEDEEGGEGDGGEGEGDPDFEEEEAEEWENEDHGGGRRRRQDADDWAPGQASGRGRGPGFRQMAPGGRGSLEGSKGQHDGEEGADGGASLHTSRRQKRRTLLDLSEEASTPRGAASGEGVEEEGKLSQQDARGGQEYSEDDGDAYYSNGGGVKHAQDSDDDHGSDEG